jgi:hypothetical protein
MLRTLKSQSYDPSIIQIPDRKTLQNIVIEDMD